MSTPTGRRPDDQDRRFDQTPSNRRLALGIAVGCLFIGGAAIVAFVGFRGGSGQAAASGRDAAAPLAAAGAAVGPAELAALRAENAQLRQANQELSAAAAEIRAAGEKQGRDRGSADGAAPTRPHGRADGHVATPAEAERWIVLFRADDPSAWDSPSYTAERFGVPLHLVPDFRYLRLRRMDTGEALILHMTRNQLRNDKPPHDDTGYWWSGTGSLAYGGRHLGIVQGPRYKFPGPHGMICPMFDGWDGFAGSGFGHKYGVGDVQYYSWRGQEIPKTVFEIAVTSGPLTAEEELFVVGKP
jgi:hypothetical protein